MALNFGTSGKFLFKSSGSVNVPCTLAAFGNFAGVAATNALIGIFATGTQAPMYLFTDSSGKANATSYDGTNSGAATTAASVSANTWVHIAGVWASLSSRSVYLNGANKVTNTTTVNSLTTGYTFIGGDNVYPNPCNGLIAFAGIWNIALSDADIASLAAGAAPWKVHPEALVGFLRLVGQSPEPDIVSPTGWSLTGGPTLASSNPPIFIP